VRRAIIKVVYETLKEHGIPFPYNHLDVELVNTDQQKKL